MPASDLVARKVKEATAFISNLAAYRTCIIDDVEKPLIECINLNVGNYINYVLYSTEPSANAIGGGGRLVRPEMVDSTACSKSET